MPQKSATMTTTPAWERLGVKRKSIEVQTFSCKSTKWAMNIISKLECRRTQRKKTTFQVCYCSKTELALSAKRGLRYDLLCTSSSMIELAFMDLAPSVYSSLAATAWALKRKLVAMWFLGNSPNQLLHLSAECVMLSQPSHIWLWHGLLKVRARM